MSTASAYLTVRGIDVDVVYKDIKNLHIGVYPPVGRVRVAAPSGSTTTRSGSRSSSACRGSSASASSCRTRSASPQREMVTGESHYVWGVRHRLKVIERPGRAHVEIDGDRLLLYVPEGTDSESARASCSSAGTARSSAKRIPPLIAKWEPIVGAQVPQWSIRRMKTKWGSCNRETGHIWFNLELAKKHPDCLEYIVVHEMTHLLERNHGERFTKLMDGFMPDWRARRDQLNDAPLAAEVWG